MTLRRAAATRPQIRGNTDLQRYLPLRQNIQQLLVFHRRQNVPQALRSNVQRGPDSFRTNRFAGMCSQVQACIARLCIQVAKRLRTGAPFVPTNTDADNAGGGPPKLLGLVKDARRLLRTEVPNGVEDPEQ